MNRSPLHDRHVALGARMAPFAGWEMPIQYESIVAEHRAVRERAGMFDISHMGEFRVTGDGAGEWANSLFTNDVSLLSDGEGQYTLMLNETGGVIDDLILYRVAGDDYILVVNAARIAEDWKWMKAHHPEGPRLIDQSPGFGALAIQGPEAVAAWEKLEPGRPLPPRSGIAEWGDHLLVCRTGYTGEDGFELFAARDEIGSWFDRFQEAGVTPCGLGARDTLRLEKCYPLNGSDLDEVHTPLEAGLGMFVKLEKGVDFPGRDRLLRQKEKGLSERLSAIAVTGKAPPLRHGYEVRDAEGKSVLGTLTSGTISPTLGKGIGLAYLPSGQAKAGTEVAVAIRDRVYPAEVVKKPFL